MLLAPIALFTYNRVDHTRKTIEALSANVLASDSDLYIFSDGFKNEFDKNDVLLVRDFVKKIKNFKNVYLIERDQNLGLSDNIIDGVSHVCNLHGKVIVLEDDLITSPFFLTYMNDAIHKYINNPKVCSIHGYVYPVDSVLPNTFFIKGADCWGWATWSSAWNSFETNGNILLNEIKHQNLIKQFNFNNTFDYFQMLKDQTLKKNNSWAIRWYASCFLKNLYTLYPGKSLVTNIGFDNSGTHSGSESIFDQVIFRGKIDIQDIPIENNQIALEAFYKYFKRNKFYTHQYKKYFKKIIPFNILNLFKKIF